MSTRDGAGLVSLRSVCVCRKVLISSYQQCKINVKFLKNKDGSEYEGMVLLIVIGVNRCGGGFVE